MGRGSKQTFFQGRHTDGPKAHERYSVLLIIREIQTTISPHTGLLLKRQGIPNVEEDVEKREPSWTVDGTVNRCSHNGKQYGESSKKKKKKGIELLYDPAIPLLGIYLKNAITLIWKDICTPLFIAALFTIVKIWKQPKVFIDGWNGRRCGIYIYIYIYTHTQWDTTQTYKKNEILPFLTTWMDLEGIVLSEISQLEKDKKHMILFTWNLEIIKQTNKIKQKQTQRYRKPISGYQRGRGLWDGWNGCRRPTLW